MNSKSPLILLVLITLLAGGSRAYTIEELNNHFKAFFENAGAYLRQGGGKAGVYESLYGIKNEFEQKYESGTLDEFGLDPNIIRVAGAYIKVEAAIFQNIFGADIGPEYVQSWGDYLSRGASLWKAYYEDYYTGGTLYGYTSRTIREHIDYWNAVSPLMRRFLDAQAPDQSLIGSIGQVAMPPMVPQPIRSPPSERGAEYMDDMIRDAVAIPLTLVIEARSQISARNSWESTFAEWKSAMDAHISAENDRVHTVAGWLDEEE